ncbi:hypothetical protein AOXY_G6217 [Acipenser oxyrinchus oxyrinchus]|uniref:Uncharacterized protein n=1 Tax=Acipenser oxyrinchus oxyrinchus TaxID=40147 RepID=A0AAD8GBJ8_ACIOX|nr:hypothetical protein AOXY_G6217 [Acipenser oxyrinchus oxyrinchus]
MQLQEGIPALIDASVKKYVQKHLPSKVRPTETSPEQAAHQLHPVANSAAHAEISCNRDSKIDGLLTPIAQQEARRASDYKK